MSNLDLISMLLYGQDDDIIEYCTENNIGVDTMTRDELINAYLEWNGIIGYTGRIIDLVQILKNIC